MTATPSRTRQKLKPGAVVRCRTRRYLVEDVQAPLDPGADTVVALACMEDDAIGSRLTVFREREIDFEVLGESSWGAVAQRGFDQPRQFSAYLNTLRWNCLTATDAELFQAPYRAGINVKAYQLEPLRKALLMPRVGLFIADDVGLGKTIETGLILREMLLRQRIRRVVISCPPSVLRQWQEEMISRFLISHALLRNPEYSCLLRVWLEEGKGDEDQAPLQSLLILDEAHNAAPASNSLRYAIDSGLTRSLRARFVRGVPFDPKVLDTVLVRRLKDDLRRIGEEFPERIVEPLAIPRGSLPPDTPELKLSRLLQNYRKQREGRLIREGAGKRELNAERLVITNLQQRLLSPIEAFARTLKVHQRSLAEKQGQRRGALAINGAQLDLLLGGADRNSDLSELSEEDLLNLEEAQTRAALRQTVQADQGELELLKQMGEIAEANRHRPDPRIIRSEREQAWNVLRQALEAGTTEGISETRRDQLQAQAAADVAALKPALDQAAEQAQAVAAALLKQRGDAEAAALKEVLRAQRSRINATVKQRNRDLAKLDRQAAAAEPTALIPGLEEQLDVPALDLQKLTTQERKQLAADQKHWQRRLETIEAELSSEPKRIQESYRVITHRLEPAGLVYLWPISG
ncbi:MAG: SNF2-related protein [Cyanobacteria bacterium]|nr:SNF2-related protein [Cyanobacteriota bacterium]